MFNFKIDEPSAGLREVLDALASHGITEDSRNGPVIRFPAPVCLEYVNPRRRLLTDPLRDANPFFHLFETLWMFAGMDEIQPLLLFNSGMAQYSDDGVKLRGTAYGHRWRSKWGDQLRTVIQKLTDNPEDRRIVMSMWDPAEIFLREGKDFACNLQVLFSTRPAVYKGSSPSTKEFQRRLLDMTVTNRSNDVIYGAMGSNMFHFSMLHELVAHHANLELGTYYQMANNLHLYTEMDTQKKIWQSRNDIMAVSDESPDHSLTDEDAPMDIFQYGTYVRSSGSEMPTNSYLKNVVHPLISAYRIYKTKTLTGIEVPLSRRYDMAISLIEHCSSRQLREACAAWMNKRIRDSRSK